MHPDPTLDALADPTRRAVFELLVARGPQAVTDLAALVPVSRPAVSQHLKVLVEAGLAEARPEGTRRIYSADPSGLRVIGDWLSRQWESVLEQFETMAQREAQQMTATTRIQPVVKTRTVALPPDRAFALFTERLGAWWPVRTHSIQGDDVVDIRFDGRVGGRVVEIAEDGTEHSWADVLAWDPPDRFVLSWHPSVAPAAASRLEVRFLPVDGGCEVVLTHDGWEEFGEDGVELRERYDQGWEIVLEPFTCAVEELGAG